MPRCQDFASFVVSFRGPRRPPHPSLRSLHFTSILKKNPSIQNLNETTAMLHWIPYPCYIESPTNVISHPFPWYIDHPFQDIINLRPMAYRTPYPWYIEPPTHGILNPLSMLYWTPYSWYIESLPMVFWTPYPWHFDLLIHAMFNPLSMVYRTPFPW